MTKAVYWDVKQQNKQKKNIEFSLNSFLASSDFGSLLMIDANSLDPNQDQQNVGPDLDPTALHSDSVPEKLFLKKSLQTTTKVWMQC